MPGAEFTSMVAATQCFLRERHLLQERQQPGKTQGREKHVAHSPEDARFPEKASKSLQIL